MKPRPDVWSVGLVMVDDLYVEGEPRTMGLLGGGAAYACVGAAYAGARAGLVARAGAGIDPDALAQLQQCGLVLEVKQVAAPSIHERVYVSATRETVYEWESGSGDYEGTCPRPRDFTSDLAPDQCVHIAPIPVTYQAAWIEFAADAEVDESPRPALGVRRRRFRTPTPISSIRMHRLRGDGPAGDSNAWPSRTAVRRHQGRASPPAHGMASVHVTCSGEGVRGGFPRPT